MALSGPNDRFAYRDGCVLMQVLIVRSDSLAPRNRVEAVTTFAGAALRQRLIAAHSAVLCQLAATKMSRLASGRPLVPGDDLDLARKAAQKAVEGIGHLVKFRAHMLAARIKRATARPWESDLPHAANQYRAFRELAAAELSLVRAALADAEAALFGVKVRQWSSGPDAVDHSRRPRFPRMLSGTDIALPGGYRRLASQRVHAGR